MNEDLKLQIVTSVVDMMDRLCSLSINYIGNNTDESVLSDLEEAIYDARRLSDKFRNS